MLAWAAQGEQARVPTDAVTLPAGRYALEQVLQRLKAVLPPLQWQEGPPRPIRIDDNPALTPWGITGPIVHQAPSLGPVTRKVARGKTIRDVLNQVADRTGRVWCALALNGNLETPLAFRLADGTPVRGTQFRVDASLDLRP